MKEVHPFLWSKITIIEMEKFIFFSIQDLGTHLVFRDPDHLNPGKVMVWIIFMEEKMLEFLLLKVKRIQILNENLGTTEKKTQEPSWFPVLWFMNGTHFRKMLCILTSYIILELPFSSGIQNLKRNFYISGLWDLCEDKWSRVSLFTSAEKRWLWRS